jgi:hypothetical protein
VAEQAPLGEPLDGRRDGAGTDAERLGQVAGVGDGRRPRQPIDGFERFAFGFRELMQQIFDGVNLLLAGAQGQRGALRTCGSPVRDRGVSVGHDQSRRPFMPNTVVGILVLVLIILAIVYFAKRV